MDPEFWAILVDRNTWNVGILSTVLAWNWENVDSGGNSFDSIESFGSTPQPIPWLFGNKGLEIKDMVIHSCTSYR